MVRKSYKKEESGMHLRVLIEDDRVETERADGMTFGRYSWSAFSAFLEGPNTFALYLNPMQFILVPKRVMTSEQQREFLAVVSLKIPSKGAGEWKSPPAASGP